AWLAATVCACRFAGLRARWCLAARWCFAGLTRLASVRGGFTGAVSADADDAAPGHSDDDASAVVVPGPATAMARAPVATTEVAPMTAVRPHTACRARSRVCRAWCWQQECGPWGGWPGDNSVVSVMPAS